jgi:hypothetical protein
MRNCAAWQAGVALPPAGRWPGRRSPWIDPALRMLRATCPGSPNAGIGRQAFVCALPLTVPGGLLAILADTFVAHPIQVADDAWDDASWLWREGRPDFEHRYYSETAFLPVRAAITPVVLLGSFLGRSMFDVSDEEAGAVDRAEAEAAARRQFLDWLHALAAGGWQAHEGRPPALDEELRQAIVTALRQSHALGRLQLYRFGLRDRRAGLPFDPLDGLRDPDPAVRFSLLEEFGRRSAVPDDLKRALADDPDEAVRVLARRLWPVK